MRVFCRALSGLLLLVVCSSGAFAAPILISTPSASCGAVVLAISEPNCAAADVNPFAGSPIDGTFTFNSDVALFRFLLTEDTLFSAFTSSYDASAGTGFDATLGLFDNAGAMVTYADPSGSEARFAARGVDVSDGSEAPVDYDDVLPQILLAPGQYYLALLLYPNNFSLDPSGLDSLLAGFALDDPLLASECLDGCSFSLALTAEVVDGGPEPVPEPGTLGLLALGSACAALVRRRRAA